jgi:hypothetical protein
MSSVDSFTSFLGFSCSWFEEWWYCSTARGAAFLAEGDF